MVICIKRASNFRKENKINIIIDAEIKPDTFESYRNVLKVFSLGGHEAFVWDKSQKSCFDIWDELQPIAYIGTKLEDKEKKLCRQYKTKFVFAQPTLYANIFQYAQQFTPSEVDVEVFGCDYLSIINHDTTEVRHLLPYLNKGYKFKLFSIFPQCHSEYCGFIPDNLNPLALKCAKTPIATNFLNLFNFTLANPNTIYPEYSKTESYPIKDIITYNNPFLGARRLIDENNLNIDLNTDKMFREFFN
jgi:hypothetical protein